MKATMVIDKNGNYRYELDKEAIKAIRFCKGYNIDLRVKLTTVNRSYLWDWIDENFIGIVGFGNAYGGEGGRPLVTDPEWRKYERSIWDMVTQICD